MSVRRFAFIGSPAACYDKCSAQSGANAVSSPNNNAEADGMASIISHELAESASDPLINAWCAHLHARQAALRSQGQAMSLCYCVTCVSNQWISLSSACTCPKVILALCCSM